MNPLDLTRLATDNKGKTICVTSISPGNYSQEATDFILGDAFLRNVYALFDYGNWTTSGDDKAFIQILSVSWHGYHGRSVLLMAC